MRVRVRVRVSTSAGGTRCHVARSSCSSLRQSAMGSAREYAPASTAARMVAGVVLSSRPDGSKCSDSSRP